MAGLSISERVNHRADGSVIVPAWILSLDTPRKREPSRGSIGLLEHPETTRHRLERDNGPGWSIQEWTALKDKYGNKCLRCREVRRLVPDHVIPLSKGGRHHIDNIQPLCHKCNFAKQLRDWDFRGE